MEKIEILTVNFTNNLENLFIRRNIIETILVSEIMKVFKLNFNSMDTIFVALKYSSRNGVKIV